MWKGKKLVEQKRITSLSCGGRTHPQRRGIVQSVQRSFMYSTNLLRTHHMPGTVLRAGDPTVNKTDKVPVPEPLHSNEELDHTHINKD